MGLYPIVGSSKSSPRVKLVVFAVMEREEVGQDGATTDLKFERCSAWRELVGGSLRVKVVA